MDELKTEEFCLENKQSDVTSSCSISDGSCGAALKSPGVCSPATTSPSHRRTTGPIRRAKGGWTPEEDETLRNAVQVFKGRCWKKIAEFFPDRSEVQCLHRWQKVLNPELIKGPWTQEEDDKIIELVSKYGPTKWSVIAKSLPGRIGKQCRERWHNHLNPMIKKDAWTLEEELLLMNAQRVHGNKWAEIAKVLPGRTDNSIKNHWNSSLKKKLDFYLATGQLPPVPKMGQNGAKDISRVTATGNFFSCSNKESDTTVETSLVDICKVEEEHKDQLERLMKQCLDMDTSTSELVIGPDNGAECKPQVIAPEERENCGSESDFCHSNYDSTPSSIKCRINGESDQEKNIAGTPLQCMIPAFGSSYHEPPLSANSDIPLDSSVLDTSCSFQQTNDTSLVMSPRSFSTPPCSKSTGLGWQIAESILKNAAKSFPNTPSILRKRKRGAQTQVSLDKIREVDVVKVKDILHTPDQTERIGNKGDLSRSINSRLCESSVCQGTVSLCSGRDFNTSPPYRLRSKRTAVFKSIEKQLDFTSDKDKFDSGNRSMNTTIKGNPHVTENCPQTMKMEVT